MNILVEDYKGEQVTFRNVKSFDFDGETGELLVWYNDEPLTCFISNYIKRIKNMEA